MSEAFFYNINPLLVCLGLIFVLVAASEFGWWSIKRRGKKGQGIFEKEDISFILGAVLTLLSLMLGFTYSMAENRFEARRQLVVAETNAIGTTYLRTLTLPESRSSETQTVLRQYAALRVEFAKSTDITPEKLRDMDTRTKTLQAVLWSQAAALARESHDPITSLFLQSLNEMIDLHTKRLAAFQNRVPLTIYLVLLIISVVALFLTGAYFGSALHRGPFLTILFAILVASVIWLILDFDQPAGGAIRASQQSLIDLQGDLSQPLPNSAK
jgi:hypothetical protein